MKHIRTVATLLLLTGLFIAYHYGIPKYIAHLVIGLSMLTFEILDAKTFQSRISNGYVFKLKSNVWTESVIITAVLLYFFSFEPMNTWNIVGISAIILSGISKCFRGTSAYYRANKEGVWNLHTNQKFIPSENITALRITNDELAIDTIKYKNELLIKSKKLVQPEWEKLTLQFIELEKTWVNKR
ncbi:MAG: hypothetical protein RIC35_13340 [Marinoscillum sp.]